MDRDRQWDSCQQVVTLSPLGRLKARTNVAAAHVQWPQAGRAAGDSGGNAHERPFHLGSWPCGHRCRRLRHCAARQWVRQWDRHRVGDERHEHPQRQEGRPAAGRQRDLGTRSRDDGRLLHALGAAGHLRDHGHERDLRHVDDAQRQGPVRPVPRAVGDPERHVRRVDDQAAARREVPERRTARRGGGEAQPRQLPWREPEDQLTAEHLRLREHRRRHGRGPADRRGEDEDALARVPVVPVQRRSHRHRRAGAAEQPRHVRDEPDRHRSVQAPGVAPERPPHRRSEPGLLAQGTALSRQDHLPTGHRRPDARQRPPGRPARRHAHVGRRRDAAPPRSRQAGRRHRDGVVEGLGSDVPDVEREQAALQRPAGAPDRRLQPQHRPDQPDPQPRPVPARERAVPARLHRVPEGPGLPEAGPEEGARSRRSTRPSTARRCRSTISPSPIPRPSPSAS